MEQNKGKVIALCGKVASGKTYYANKIKEKENVIIFSIDELTYYLFDNRKGENYIDITQRALNYFKEKSVDIVNQGIDVILDIGLWTSKERKDISEYYRNKNVEFEIHYIDIDDKSWEENINERNKRIDDGNKGFDFYVTEGLKKKMFENWEEPTEDEVNIVYKNWRKKMKVLFATTNPAKIKKYIDELKKFDIQLVTLKDLNIEYKVQENGKNCIENAIIKAKEYYQFAKIPTIGMDNSLFIEELPEEKQPGTYVRRVNGKELNDEEMIEYYTNLVKENGGRLTAKWMYGMAIYNGKEIKEYSWAKSHFYFVDEVCEKRNPGYPLDSISISPENNKYFVELAPEEKIKNNGDKSNDEVISFITNSLKQK